MTCEKLYGIQMSAFNKFYWNTTMSIHLLFVWLYCAETDQVVVTDTIWPIKLFVFIWLVPKSIC